MVLDGLDWAIIVLYFGISLFIGIRLKSKASGSLSNFFLGGRNLPWHIAGISMVATTFAADTPLWVTEKVAQHGVSGNWLWWNMLIGGMLTTFFFSKLWRRANVLTELEFIELRYSGKPAAFLRGFKSVYMGIFLNAVIIGWVNAAMIKILMVYFDIPYTTALCCIGGLMVIVAFYAALSGFLGVAITDMVQFTIAIVGCIILAVVVVNSDDVGGITGLKEKLPEWRFDFFPKIGEGADSSGAISTYSLSIGAFLTFGLVQWWASWYPGNEPGGGGYISQRIMSTKNEKHAVLATLFFQIAHYCLRPWPWIVVALCALVLYPDLPIEDSGRGFVLIMRDYLPTGLKGLLFVAFLAAYMSTISTQLNWGASYLTNDLYKRFMKPENRFETTEIAGKHYVKVARFATVFIMLFAFLATTQIKSIDGAATFLIECGAGLGLVLILRWYWWRISAWSEITASIAPFAAFIMAKYVLNMEFPNSFLFTVGISTVAWIIVTFITAPTDQKVLESFYKLVRPTGAWNRFKSEHETSKISIYLIICWLSSIWLTYSILFLLGKLIFQEFDAVIVWLISTVLALTLFMFSLRKTDLLD